MIETGPPAPQAGSRLLGLPAELRNRVYEFVFDDGKPANVRNLFSCRQIYNEAHKTFYTSVCVRARHMYPDHIDWWNVDVDILPPSILCSLSLAIYEDHHWNTVATWMPFDFHTSGLYAVNTIHEARGIALRTDKEPTGIMKQYPATDPELVLSWTRSGFNSFRYFVRRNRVRDCDIGAPLGIGVIAQWLDNPRLRKWTIRSFEADTLLSEITGVREAEDGTPLPAPSSATTPLAKSRNLFDRVWLEMTKISVIEDHEDAEFVVVVRHEELEETVRVRYKYTRLFPTAVEDTT